MDVGKEESDARSCAATEAAITNGARRGADRVLSIERLYSTSFGKARGAL